MALLQDDTAPAPTFQWGANGARMTADQIAAQRKVADAMAAQAGDASPFPVGTRGAGEWTQGLARVAKGISAGLDYREADNAAKANADDNTKMIAALLSGGATPAASSGAVPAAVAAPTPTPPAAAADTTGKIYSNDEPSPLDPPSGADRDATIRTVYGEAANEPTVGQQAVASVIRNRAVDGGYGGDTPTAVVHAPNQFEPWNGGPALARMQALSPSDPKYAAIGKVVDAAYGTGGRAPDDPTEGKTMFYAPAAQAALGRPAPSWAQGQGQVIGGHTFYDDEDQPQGKPVQVASNGPAQAMAFAGTPTPGVAKVAGAIDPTAAPVAAAPAPVATAAAAPGVTKVAGALGTVNPNVVQALTSPYSSPATKQIAGLVLAQQMKPHLAAPYKDADGNLVQAGPDGTVKMLSAADKTPTSVSEYNFYKSQLPPGETAMPYQTWSVQKARAGATNVTTTVGGENKGMEEAQKLDAEAVRKGQNEKMPALDDADRNFQMMQDAIDRNGGKLPTGGVLGKAGLDLRRTSSYIRDNWGIDFGDDPTTAVSLETVNKGGIKASGDMARAIGGNRVLKVEFDNAIRANPGLETTDGGNKYLIDLNRNTIGIQKDYLQAQEDYWRGHNHSLDGFQKSWNAEVKANPRPLSNFSVAPPVDNGDGTQMVKLPSTAQGGYSWYQKGPNGNTVISDPAITSKLEDASKPLATAAAAPVEKTVGGKTYIKQDGNWFEKH